MAANDISNGESGLSARTKLNYLLGDSYNVKLFGLVGDGVTDDRAALNTLLNTTAPSGSTIYFPPGTYLIGSNITVSGKQFNLAGRQAVITTTANTQIIQVTGAVTKWNITNLMFSGNNTGANQYGLYFNGVGSFVIDDCFFATLGGGGIAVASTQNSTSLGGIISACKFYSNNVAIDGLSRAEYLQVVGCDIISNTKGAQLMGGNVLVTGCNITYNGTGLEIISGTNNGHCVISGNQISHNTTYNINVHDTALGMTFIGNHMYSSGIRIKDTTGVVIVGGIIDSTAYTFDTNVGLTFKDVQFDSSNANTITLTGTAPVYINCQHVDGRYAYDADNFGSVLESAVSTTDATVTALHTIPVANGTTTMVSGYVLGRRTGGAAGTAEDGALYFVQIAIRCAAGTAAVIGSTVTVIGEDQAGWDVTITVSTSNAVVKVTGAANNNIDWKWTPVKYSTVV